jgi:hypothetical protein
VGGKEKEYWSFNSRSAENRFVRIPSAASERAVRRCFKASIVERRSFAIPLPPDVVPLIREFANNSFRYLFRQTDNIADLLRRRESKIARGIDFAQMAVQPETFIAPSFAQLESDVIQRARSGFGAARLGVSRSSS